MPYISCGSYRAPLSAGNRHVICTLCLGPHHAALALDSGGCMDCEVLLLSTLWARLEAFTTVAVTPLRKQRRSQRIPETEITVKGSPDCFRPTSHSPSPPLPDAQLPSSAHTAAASGDKVERIDLGDSCSILASDIEEWWSSYHSASSSVQESSRTRAGVDAEHLCLLSKAVVQLGLDWSPPKEPMPNRLHGCFLHSHCPPPVSRSAPFLQELHVELSKSWSAPFSKRLQSHVSLALSQVSPRFWVCCACVRVPHQALASGRKQIRVTQSSILALVSGRLVPAGYHPLQGQTIFGLWSDQERRFHINCQEMIMVENLFRRLVLFIQDHHDLVRSDNMSVVSYITRQGGVRRLCHLTECLLV
ncbi:hypothetical protein F2P79_024753 [Pimephales promelas]|nr:hypothetical protein F2P79_024753 [Pimephales promelas]